jgi:hypothetical protein
MDSQWGGSKPADLGDYFLELKKNGEVEIKVIC